MTFYEPIFWYIANNFESSDQIKPEKLVKILRRITQIIRSMKAWFPYSLKKTEISRHANHQKGILLAIGMVIIILCPKPALGSDTNVLLNGDVSKIESPLPYWFGLDFTVTYSLIPTADDFLDQDLVKRYMRLYSPRSQAEMDNYDAIFHVEADFSDFTDKSLTLLHEATMKEGNPSFLSPPFGAPYSYSWVNSFMLDMSPHDLSREKDLGNFLITSSWTVKFAEERPPVLTMFRGYGLGRIRGTNHIALYPKPGSAIWARMSGARDPRGRKNPPFMISWRYGEGLVWAIAQDYDRDWWGVVPGLSGWDHTVNPVSPDIVLNMLYYSVGRELPEDIAVVHEVRTIYRSLSDSRRLLISVLEFIESFGADTNRLTGRMKSLDTLEAQAEELFWQGRYEESLEPIEEALEKYKEIENDAMKAKQDVLLWVYITEWLVISATGMICGFVLWSIMVRRRLYREAKATRLRHSK